jgi:hypothetical protein
MVFPFVPVSAGPIGSVLMPILPIRLTHGSKRIDEPALVDTGSVVNVLPYDLGIRLGLDWNAPAPLLPLAGNVARHMSKGVVLTGTIGNYPPVQLTFAWSQSPDARLILGNFNFLAEFDALFFRSRGIFEVRPRP